MATALKSVKIVANAGLKHQKTVNITGTAGPHAMNVLQLTGTVGMHIPTWQAAGAIDSKVAGLPTICIPGYSGPG